MFHTCRRWIILVLAFCALGPLGLGCSHEDPDDAEHDKTSESEPSEASPVGHNAEGETVVSLDEEGQAHAGLVVQPLVAATLQPERTAYGRLEEDPQQSFTLRAPVAGILRSTGAQTWPQLGDKLENGASIGKIEPRLGPVERADLASRLSTAHAEVAEVSADLAAARHSFENKKELNAKEQIVSERTLEEAEAKVKGQEARLKSAQETVKLIEASLEATEGPTGPRSLTVASGGDVVELMVSPGESVEAGQTILRVARYDRLLARVELPAGESLGFSSKRARIIVAGQEDHPLEGQLTALAPTINAFTGGQGYLFQVAADGLTLRPGLPVTAFIAQPGEPQKGVTLPRSAVLRMGGKTWIYLKTEKNQFTRHAVDGLRPMAEGWFASGLHEGQDAVVVGGQALLSMEFTSQAGKEEEEEEE